MPASWDAPVNTVAPGEDGRDEAAGGRARPAVGSAGVTHQERKVRRCLSVPFP